MVEVNVAVMTSTVEAVFEDGVFRPLDAVALSEGQAVVLSVKPVGMSRRQAAECLAQWHAVYEGLSEQDIDEIERIALDRSRFLNRPPVDLS